MKRLLLVFLFFLSTFNAFSQYYQVPIYSVTSLQPGQPGSLVSNCIDNDNTTTYHSKWGQSGIPDELLFYFTSNVSSVKKLVYTPRQSGTNGLWTNVSIYYSTQAAPNTFILINANLSWQANNLDKEIVLANAIQNPFAIKFVVNAGSGNFSSCAEMRFYSETQTPIITGVDCAIPTAELIVNGANDVKATILAAGSTASSFQPGENINLSFDNDVNTWYHSAWSGNTVFPVVLNYRLNGTTPIDYFKYIPRTDGGDNGNFGSVTVSYNTTSNSTFIPLLTFNFQESGIPTNVYFPNQITPLNIRISVANGTGNFASCAEMEFYTSAAANGPTPYANYFATNLYDSLLPTVTQTDINGMASPFYKGLAQCLFDGTYVSQYRVKSCEVYPTVSSVSNSLKVGGYDSFENATGIVFQQGDKIALFVQNIPSSTSVTLKVKDFETELGGPVSYYELHNGLNVFQLTNSGLGYISYYDNNATLPNIQINVVSGKVNGYFNYQTSSTAAWPTLLSNAAYPMVDVVGEYAHLVYKKEILRNGTPLTPLGLIGKYDIVIRHERMLMGLYKYNRSPKNHQLSYSNHGGGWYAGGLGINLDFDWGPESVADANQLGIWGIAHEFGHINQIRPSLKWIGTTEVTNNVYSAWVDYNMNQGGNPYSRLEEEQVAPTTGMVDIEGGRINGAIFNTHVNNEHMQGNANSDVFKILVPFWQLELYYQLAGASRNAPVLSFNYPQNYSGIDYAHWYGMVAEISRNTNTAGLTNGELLLNFVKNTCDVVQENLIGFFQKSGFLKPIDIQIDDYGPGQLTITQAQIDATIAYVQSKNYQAPVSPVMDYISAHSVNAFKNQLPLSGQTGIGVALNNNYLTVQHSEWHNAVAYETLNAANQLIYVSISGTGDVSNQTTQVYYPANAASVYAIGFDGQRILVYPANLSVGDVATPRLVVYPNPVDQNSPIHLELGNTSSNYNAQIIGLDGRTILNSNGSLKSIEEVVNANIMYYQSGIYVLCLKDENDNQFRVKVIKK